MTVQHPAKEAARIEALRAYEVLDTDPEESFDRITRLAKLALRAPIALVSLVDTDRQWFKSRQGLDTAQTSRETSFCSHTIEQDGVLIINDATRDPRFCGNPLVNGKPDIRAYAGMPLKTPAGYNIGTLCVIDTKPRQFSTDELSVLHDLARLVVDELELRKIAAVDSLTGARTVRSFYLDFQQEIARSRRYQHPLSVVCFDIDHFKLINDSYGHAAGDLVLQELTAICNLNLRAGDIFGRLGGEEFAFALPETDGDGALRFAERIRELIGNTPIPFEGDRITATASFGIAVLTDVDMTPQDLIRRADEALYRAKQAGRDRTILDATTEIRVAAL